MGSRGLQAAGPLEQRGSRLPYLPGLDGLRAFAVILVLLYHADPRWLPGGFLGVEVFFTISGYLITSLLLAEWQEAGRIDLGSFWLRRARRLLPALYALIAATLAYAVLFLPGQVSELRADAAAALGYVTNWYLVFSHKPYFITMGRPSLLRHLWSLAVEEQFYLLWPPLFALGLRLGRRRGTLAAALAGAVASAALMAALYRPDLDPSRVYYGTDTRAAGLLAGAILALARAPGQEASTPAGRRDAWLDALGLAGLGTLALSALYLHEYRPFLYRGGFALVALSTVAVILALANPRTHLARLLGRRPLRWLGLRSYGIYLWHWPVYALTRPYLDLPIGGLPSLALRLALTVVLADLSYRYVERPIRSGALGRAWQRLRTAYGPQRLRLAWRWGGASTAVLTFSVLLGVSVASAQPPAPPPYLLVQEVHIVAGEPVPAEVGDARPPRASSTAAPSRRPTVEPAAMGSSEWMPLPATSGADESLRLGVEASSTPTPSTAAPRLAATAVPPAMDAMVALDAAASPCTPSPEPPTPTATALLAPPICLSLPALTPSPTPSPTPGYPFRVTCLGDSVMLGAVRALQEALGAVDVDAAVSRRAFAAIDILRAKREAGELGEVVIVHIGNNGGFDARQFDEMMDVLADVRLVLFVNIRVQRPWEAPNNDMLVEGVARYPGVVLVDWRGLSLERTDFFWDDGIHLRPEGARAYAALIAEALAANLPPGQ